MYMSFERQLSVPRCRLYPCERKSQAKTSNLVSYGATGNVIYVYSLSACPHGPRYGRPRIFGSSIGQRHHSQDASLISCLPGWGSSGNIWFTSNAVRLRKQTKYGCHAYIEPGYPGINILGAYLFDSAF
jgi:hypothetical protein